MSIKKRPLKHVTWVDSGTLSRWRDPKDIDNEPCTIETVGYVVHSDKKAMTLAQSFSHNGDLNSCMTIPRGCIKAVKSLK